MARLIDLLQRQSKGRFLHGLMRDTQILVADTIFQEMEDATNKGRVWKSEDFPRAAPPFKHMWIEGRVNEDMWGGSVVHVIDANDTDLDPYIMRLMAVKREYIRWVVSAFSMSASERHGKLMIALGSHLQMMGIDDEGRITAGLTTPILKPAPDVEDQMAVVLKLPISRLSVQVNVAPMLLKTFALMNCVNVKQETVEPPPALSKSHSKKYGVPMSSYKVLTVKGQNISQAKPSKGGTHSTPRLHMVRGHFKHLQSGKTSWWQPHLRGRDHDEDGSIRKTYKVVKPETEIQ